MAAKRVIRIRLGGEGEPLPPKKPAAPKTRADLDLEAIKAKAAEDARKKGTTPAQELARLIQHYLNQD